MGNKWGTACLASCAEPCCPCVVSKKVPWRKDGSQLTEQFMSRSLQHGIPDPQSSGHTGGLRRAAIPRSAFVTTLRREIFAVGEGLMSTMWRLHLSYVGGDGGSTSSWPEKVVAKTTPPKLRARAVGAVLKLFRSEVEWYTRSMPAITGLAAPKCFYAADGGYGRYCLLLEDMAPAKTVSQLQGLDKARALVATRAAARLHARYRDRVGVAPETKDWVLRADDDHYYSLVGKTYRTALAALFKNGGARFKRYEMDPDTAVSTSFRAAADLVARRWDTLQAARRDMAAPASSGSTRHATLCHGDFRVENMFFDAGGTGAMLDGADARFRAVDYQLVKEYAGESDLSYFVSGSLTPETRRACEREILLEYYHAVRAGMIANRWGSTAATRGLGEGAEGARGGGVADYPMKELLLEYQGSLLNPLVLSICAQAETTGSESARGRRLVRECMFRRIDEMLSDWNFLASLEMTLKKYEEGPHPTWTMDEARAVLPKQWHDLLAMDGPSSTHDAAASAPFHAGGSFVVAKERSKVTHSVEQDAMHEALPGELDGSEEAHFRNRLASLDRRERGDLGTIGEEGGGGGGAVVVPSG